MTRIAQTTKMKYVDIYDLSVSFIIRTKHRLLVVVETKITRKKGHLENNDAGKREALYSIGTLCNYSLWLAAALYTTAAARLCRDQLDIVQPVRETTADDVTRRRSAVRHSGRCTS
jgi:hypothetical protein